MYSIWGWVPNFYACTLATVKRSTHTGGKTQPLTLKVSAILVLVPQMSDKQKQRSSSQTASHLSPRYRGDDRGKKRQTYVLEWKGALMLHAMRSPQIFYMVFLTWYNPDCTVQSFTPPPFLKNWTLSVTFLSVFSSCSKATCNWRSSQQEWTSNHLFTTHPVLCQLMLWSDTVGCNTKQVIHEVP